MNRVHGWLCATPRWRRLVEADILPWVLEGVDLGAHALEVGPGPGAATEALSRRVRRLTCVELDASMAERLARRMAGRNVSVLCDDATRMRLESATMDGAVCLTMLHHVGSPALQDLLLAEVARVLRPGGVFAGFDILSSPLSRLVHAFDTMVAVDPGTLGMRLTRAGFVDVAVHVRSRGFRFRATRASRGASTRRAPG